MSHWSEGIMDKARALAIESAELALEGAPEPHLLEEMRSFLEYNEENGSFYWKRKAARNTIIGSVAGARNDGGYIIIAIRKRKFRAHRLAWLFVHGSPPPGDIDHINGVRDDNRIANLRLATHSQNMANSRVPCTNTSGIKGVVWDKKLNKWRALIKVNKKSKHIGLFEDKEAAAAAYLEVAKAHFGEYARGV